ncbi:MAG TPA: GNAT family N-acetyltransferase [Candidatus Paceibacterota bacterium]|nr:GNAT family N-acetyltransferase [Candidatus Paceibacterota bacterium]
MEFKILTIDEIRLYASRTNQIAYADSFAEFVKRHHGLDRQMVGMINTGTTVAVVPVFIGRRNGQLHAEIPALMYYVDPLIMDHSFDILSSAVGRALRKFLGADTLIFNILSQTAVESAQFTAYILDTQGYGADDILTRLIDKKARQIKIAARRGVLSRRLAPGEYRQAYGLFGLQHSERGWVSKSRSYFQNLETVFGENLVMFGAFVDGVLAAVNICIVYKDYLWMVHNISLQEYRDHHVNDAVYWEMIRGGRGQGIRFFDYGGSLSADYGGKRFKESFGGRAHSLVRRSYYKNPFSRLIYLWDKKLRHLRQRIKKS